MKISSILNRGLLAGVIVTLTTTAAQAAVITWSAPTGISGDSDVSTTGTLLEAYNIGTTNTTVSGVTFTALPLAGSNASAGNVTLTTPGTFGFPLNASSGNAPFSGLSAAYQTLLGEAGFSFAEPVTLTLGGLIVGESYQFQWWTNYSGLGTAVFTTATAGDSVTLGDNPSTLAGGLGQYAIGTFVADSATQLIAFSTADSSASTINAFQFRSLNAIPEPTTTTLLLGAALIGLLGQRRRCSTV